MLAQELVMVIFDQGSWSVQYVVSKQDVFVLFFYLWDYSLNENALYFFSKCIMLYVFLYTLWKSSFHSGHSGEGHYIIVLMKCQWCNGLSVLNECNDSKTSPGLKIDVLFDFSCLFKKIKMLWTLFVCVPFIYGQRQLRKGDQYTLNQGFIMRSHKWWLRPLLFCVMWCVTL